MSGRFPSAFTNAATDPSILASRKPPPLCRAFDISTPRKAGRVVEQVLERDLFVPVHPGSAVGGVGLDTGAKIILEAVEEDAVWPVQLLRLGVNTLGCQELPGGGGRHDTLGHLREKHRITAR